MSPHTIIDELRWECAAFDRAAVELANALGLDGSSSWQDRHTLRLLMDGPKTLGQLATDRGIARSSVAAGICRLEASGHVTRSDHPKHDQARLVSLTGKGRELAERSYQTMRCICYFLAEEVDLDDVRHAVETMRTLKAAMLRFTK